MDEAPAIVLICGYPAAGKLTVAAELVTLLEARGHTTRLVDNHYLNNVVFGVLDVDGQKPIPDPAWGLILDVRRAVLEAIRTLSPPDWSFVFTNWLAADHDEWVVDELARLAEDRRCRFLMVRLTCEPTTLVERVASPERRGRMKWTDPEALASMVVRHRLIEAPPGVDHLTIDTTTEAADVVAGRIATHLATGAAGS